MGKMASIPDLPMEKTEENLRSKSLRAFVDKYGLDRGLRLSLSGYREQAGGKRAPLRDRVFSSEGVTGELQTKNRNKSLFNFELLYKSKLIEGRKWALTRRRFG
jgi:hypothetical protein